MAIDVIVGALLGFGAAEAVSSLTSTPKTPSPPATPGSPAAGNSSAVAAATVKDQREVLLASGGQTDFTQGLALLGESDISKPALIGG